MKKKMSIIVIGDGEVGKTSLLKAYDEKKFTNQHVKTVGVDFIRKNVEIEGVPVEVKLWDTAGQERFRTITYQFYRQADGIILAFDLTNENSFRNVRVWLQSIYKFCEVEKPKILVGNKVDLLENGQSIFATEDAVSKLINDHKMSYFKTSAKEGEGVSQMFNSIIDLVYDYKIRGEMQDERAGRVSEP